MSGCSGQTFGTGTTQWLPDVRAQPSTVGMHACSTEPLERPDTCASRSHAALSGLLRSGVCGLRVLAADLFNWCACPQRLPLGSCTLRRFPIPEVTGSGVQAGPALWGRTSTQS